MNFNILGREFLFEMKDNRNRDTRNNVKNTIRKNKDNIFYIWNFRRRNSIKTKLYGWKYSRIRYNRLQKCNLFC